METPTYKALTAKNGAVLCLDELDGATPDATMVTNALTNGDEACFPHPVGCIPRHDNLYIVATANTFNGVEAKFAGRFEMDGALRDRFYVVNFQHDLDFENYLYPEFPEWNKYVQHRAMRRWTRSSCPTWSAAAPSRRAEAF